MGKPKTKDKKRTLVQKMIQVVSEKNNNSVTEVTVESTTEPEAISSDAILIDSVENDALLASLPIPVPGEFFVLITPKAGDLTTNDVGASTSASGEIGRISYSFTCRNCIQGKAPIKCDQKSVQNLVLHMERHHPALVDRYKNAHNECVALRKKTRKSLK
jgi:hypothetical protein